MTVGTLSVLKAEKTAVKDAQRFSFLNVTKPLTVAIEDKAKKYSTHYEKCSEQSIYYESQLLAEQASKQGLQGVKYFPLEI